MRKLWFLCVLMALAPSASLAREVMDMEVVDLQAEEITQCVAYFYIGNKCVADPKTGKADSEQEQVLEKFGEWAAILNERAGYNEAVLMARIKRAIREERKLIGNSCRNLEALIEKFRACPDYLTAPDAHYQLIKGRLDVIRQQQKKKIEHDL